jgi:hypothetical protein
MKLQNQIAKSNCKIKLFKLSNFLAALKMGLSTMILPKRLNESKVNPGNTNTASSPSF